MALTDSQIRSALPADSRYRLSDGEHGLYLCVHPHGGKYFVFRFTWRGKDAELGLGTYPKKTLKDARKAAADADQNVEDGIDPREKRRAAKVLKRPTFREVAEDWFATRTKPSGKDPTRQRPPLAPKTISKMRWILDDHLYPSPGPGLPSLAELDFDDIRSPQLLATLRAYDFLIAGLLGHLGVSNDNATHSFVSFNYDLLVDESLSIHRLRLGMRRLAKDLPPSRKSHASHQH